MPASTTTVVIQKVYRVYVDTRAKCYAAGITLETGASLVFSPVEFAGSSLTVYGDLSVADSALIQISPVSPNSFAYLDVRGNISVGKNGQFYISLDTSSVIFITAYSLQIDGFFGCYYNNRAGNINFNFPQITNSGIFEVINTTDTARTITIGKIKNKGRMNFIALDPNPANPAKPDPPTVGRYLVLTSMGNSALLTIREADYNAVPSVGLRMLNVKISGIGVWDTCDEEGNPLYGIGFIGKAAPIDGRKDIVSIYNCEISNSPDTGIFFKNCSRINTHWGQISISSNIIRGCVTAGIWLMENVEKCDIKHNKIYNIWGGNVGYGILLGMPLRYGSCVAPAYPQGFANENNIYNNEVYNNKIRGIYVYHSHKNLIDSNKCYNHLEEGISLKNSVRNVLMLNECYNNYVHGIALDGVHGDPTSGSKQNYIANNKCYNNNNGGIRI
ncbi:MAG: right-handed parallel beta-helix repeat-containing protein, partial [Endomicrobia bacterium]|nr:right-handed parallel beta-helix repeat-containing protein [Endomicrobiia bacterium]